MGRCKACWLRRARERHHWALYARWHSHTPFRRWVQDDGPTVALCRPCHRRITRWDNDKGAGLPLPLATLAGIAFGWARLAGGVLFIALLLYAKVG